MTEGTSPGAPNPPAPGTTPPAGTPAAQTPAAQSPAAGGVAAGAAPGERRRGKPRSRDELRAQVQATRADFERQVLARKAQLDATNEKIAERTGRNLILA